MSSIETDLAERRRDLNDAPVRGDASYVLYWMVAARRTRSNFALERAVAWCRELGKPLVVLEAIRAGHPWAAERFHAFVLDGMRENAARLAVRGVTHHGYVEPRDGDGKGLLEALASDAAIIVTDDWPCFFVPNMQGAAAKKVSVRLEAVDANGLLPIRLADRAFSRAYDFRRFVQRELPPRLGRRPKADPLRGNGHRAEVRLPKEVAARWPANVDTIDLASLPIDHGVASVADRSGGEVAGRARLRRFVKDDLVDYGDGRNEIDGGSGLSPYLHFGHVAAWEVFDAVTGAAGWTPDDIDVDRSRGQREGWWGLPASSEAFLDQLVTWRELGFNACVSLDGYDRYESLSPWARETLEEHADDPRPALYDLETLAAAETDDPVWNYAQRQLRDHGRIVNRLRMLWGKRVLTWTRGPREALEVLLELNDRYALDGRDPNSISGIFWTLGRYDRPWPEREIFGRVRTMTSKSTARKLGAPELLRMGDTSND